MRVAQNLLLCSPTLCSKGFMTVEDICIVDMDARQKAGIRPSTSEVKTHIAMMKSVGVNAASMPIPALQCLPVCRAGSPLRHQSGSGYLPGAHPAGPLRNARLSGNGPGRGGSSPDNPPSFSRKTTESLPEHVTWKKRNGSWKMRMPTAWC